MNAINYNALKGYREEIREHQKMADEWLKNAEEAKAKYVNLCIDVLDSIKTDTIMVCHSLSDNKSFKKISVYTFGDYKFYIFIYPDAKRVTIYTMSEEGYSYNLNINTLIEAAEDAELNKAIFEFFMHKNTVIFNLIATIRKKTIDDLNQNLNKSLDLHSKYQVFMDKLNGKEE